MDNHPRGTPFSKKAKVGIKRFRKASMAWKRLRERLGHRAAQSEVWDAARPLRAGVLPFPLYELALWFVPS